MRIIVQKYGGKSVANIDRIRQVAKNIVRTYNKDCALVVVVSAMADTTDQLLEYAHQISPEPPERELDMLLTAGERISMALLSMAIWELGHSAISFTGSQSGIITDDVHTRAKIVEIRASRIISELQKGKIVIVAGFQGVSGRREVTTLGRGGSDTTAVALACALGAERCEIYSDVDGLYSGDPKLFENPRHIPEVDYETLYDITSFGAKVVHPRAVELARKYQIPILLASSITREGKSTMVKSTAMEGIKFAGVSGMPQIFWFEVKIPVIGLHELLRRLDRLRTLVKNPAISVENDVATVKFWAPPEAEGEISSALEAIGGAEIKKGRYAIVSVSGWELAESPESIETIVRLLAENRIPFVYLGTTNRSVFVVIPQEHFRRTQQIFHDKLIK